MSSSRSKVTLRWLCLALACAAACDDGGGGDADVGPVCGDGVAEAGEACDGVDLAGATCESLGHGAGVLRCGAGCVFDESSCPPAARCGDGVIQADLGEACDGAALAGATCASLGYHGGQLSCGADCQLDLEDCAAAGRCGDGALQADEGEACDGADLGGATCGGLGFFAGELACSSACELDDAGCVHATSVAVGDRAICAVDDDRAVWCWGANDLGQLGVGEGEERCEIDGSELDCRRAPTRVAGLGDVTALAMGDGVGSQACALTSDGAVWCWGSGEAGQLGLAEPPDVCEVPGDEGEIWPVPCARTPQQVPGIGGVSAISAGGAHTCAMRSDGTLWCWGLDAFHQLGTGAEHEPCRIRGLDTTCSFEPVEATVTGAAGVAAGRYHTCVLLEGSGVSCVGGNWLRQLGVSDGGETCLYSDQEISLPCSSAFRTPVGLTGDVISVGEGGGLHQCATRSDGGVWCWGRDTDGEIGDGPAVGVCHAGDLGDLACRPEPARVGEAFTAAAVAPGGGFTCGARADGTAWCWGSNETGELGLGPSVVGPVDLPRQVPGLSGVLRISTGETQTCAVTRAPDEALWCWGANPDGILGVTSAEAVVSEPAPVGAP